LNPEVPPDFQITTLPSESVIVTTVLLKVECIYAIPLGIFFNFFFYEVAGLFATYGFLL